MASETKQITVNNPPDPARIMDGLRDTGYNFNTAVADIIDNSIAANASKVIVHVDADPDMNVTVSVSDNGSGMDQNGLKNAMKYGSAERPDLNSLGKFGLGLKTASTAFCKKLSVVSRASNDAEVRKVCWDLDFIAKENQWSLLVPSVSDDDKELLDEAADGGAGTLVLWENIDRLFPHEYKTKSGATNALKRYISGLRSHVALVYQRFLDPEFKDAANVEIYINNEKVEAFDPFCTCEPNTEALQNETLELVSADEANGMPVLMKICAYLLPRKDEFQVINSSKARLGNDTQGFYVYRENRLIHFGDWMGMFKLEPHYTLLRVELSFDHSADEYLNVDIKKSRILLVDELYDYIKDQYLPAPRREAEQRSRNSQKKKISESGTEAHQQADNTIENKADAVERSKATVVDAQKGEIEIENKNGKTRTRIVIKSKGEKTGYRVVPVDTLDYNALWQAAYVDGRKAVQLNMAHPFYQKIYYPLFNKDQTTVTGLDLLFWTLAEAELSTFNEASKECFEDLRMTAAKMLSKLVEDLPEPDFDDDDE